ncbi:MAG: GH1 family beta-glucosidase [Boseongicola sp.]
MTFTITRQDFPEDFIFGVATAAYQIEGSSFGAAGSSHWDTFAATPGNVHLAHDGAVACDHFHNVDADVDLIRDGGFDAYRFSTSWARVMPDGRTPNAEGLDFYDRLADSIHARGLRPFLTLYHWDLPSALADVGGWVNGDIADRFADFTRAVTHRIGDRMDKIATINEPWCIAWLGHFAGAHAPGLRDIRATSRAMHHVLKAHAQSLQVLRAEGQQNAGIVLNFTYSEPATNSPEDIEAAQTFDGIFNRFFADALFHGRYPTDILSALEPHMPDSFQDDLPAIATPVDWLGVNYYTRNVIKYAATDAWPHYREVPGSLQKTDMDWEIYPEGLHTFLTRLKREYTGEIPIYVTENGMASDDVVRNGRAEDQLRVGFLNDHMKQVNRAIADGVPVKGYFAWSLLDNFEWACGYEKRFGIVHVDYATQVRTPKDSYFAFQKALSRG